MTDGKWTVDRPEVRVDPIPIPPLPFEGARIQRERITKQDMDEFGATIGVESLDRRSEVIKEALAEEVQREKQRKKRKDSKKLPYIKKC